MLLEVCFLATAGVLAFAPWYGEAPESRAERESRWATVEMLAQPQLPAGNPGELVAAAALIETSPDDILDIEDRSNLNPAARRSIELLEQWSESGRGVGEGEDIDSRLRPIFNLLTLNMVALQTADGPSDPRFIAAIRAAVAIRDRGGAIAGLISLALLNKALKTVEERGWPCPAILHEARLSDEMVLPILARDMLRREQWHIEHTTAPTFLAEGDFERVVTALSFDKVRERLYVHAVMGERFERAFAAKTREQVIESLRAPPRADDAPSLFVREFSELDELAARFFNRIDIYDEMLLKIDAREAAREVSRTEKYLAERKCKPASARVGVQTPSL